MHTTSWVIKLSKFCNMRCSYCYEWNELSDRRRMTLDLWERVLRAIVEHDAARAAQFPGMPHRNLIIFHGGEPLALPTAYLEGVLTRFDDIAEASQGHYKLSMQSNMFSVSDEKLALLKARNADISVSFDMVPGVRLTVAGQASEKKVAANIDRLRATGVHLGAIAVLAKHTLPHVTGIYDFFAARGMPMRILPLFDGPSERNAPSFWVDHEGLVSGLRKLFEHWIENDCRIPVYPLVEHFEAALRHLNGVRRPVWSRAHYGDAVLLVNVDGKVYRVLDAYEQNLALGDLGRQSIGEIMGSEEYAASLTRDRGEFDQQCGKCKYLGACNGSPIYGSRMSVTYSGNCPTAHACITFMIDYLQQRGYGAEEIRSLARSMNQSTDHQVEAAI